MLHHHIRAFDEERDANFDEVWDEELVPTLLDEKKYKKYWCWLSQIDLKNIRKSR
ncbi:Imm19 family immunity protein [Bacteroides ovatus]|nr:Imm19 family immunity protein [Bacteroides ovatus]